MAEPSDKTLSEWLRPVTATLTGDDVKEYQEAITLIAAQLSAESCFDLVELACGVGSAEANEWILDLARSKKGDIPLADNAALLARLACGAAVRALGGNSYATPLGLVVESAGYVGLKPVVEELAEFAEKALADAATISRIRPEPWEPVSAVVAAELESPTTETDPETNEAREVDVRGAAIRRLAEAVDSLGSRTDDRFRSIDEEYDALWWSFTNRSTGTDQPWSKVEPLARRVVLVASELGDRITRVPSPPIVGGLMATALDDKSASDVSLAEVAIAAADEGRFPGTTRSARLLPIESTVAEIRRIGAEDGTFKETLKKTLTLDASRTTSALDAARQLRREEEIGTFLV